MAQNRKKLCAIRLFCHGDEENGHHACRNGHLKTADQSEIRKAYLVSAQSVRNVSQSLFQFDGQKTIKFILLNLLNCIKGIIWQKIRVYRLVFVWFI